MIIDKFDFSNYEGKVLKKAYVHYVDPEINILFLYFVDGTILEISGLEGSELLGVCTTDAVRIAEIKEFIMEYYDFSIFYNKELFQSRIIGKEWNGHGIELSFKGDLERTLIVQSIYSGCLPDGWNDCIRLGIGNYKYTLKDIIKIETIANVINSWDPIDLLSHAPDDEYMSEIEEKYIRGRNISDTYDLARLIENVFIRCFGNDVFRKSKLECMEIALKIIP